MKADFEEEDIVPEDETEHGAGELKKVREKLKACLAEKQEYLDGWQRARADFANLKKEEASKRERLEEAVALSFAQKLIPLADSFEAGIRSAQAAADASWRKGLQSMHAELLKAFRDLGIESFEPLGEAFDPAFHTAVGRGEGEEGEHIIHVERKGYRLKDTLLRPAYVILG